MANQGKKKSEQRKPFKLTPFSIEKVVNLSDILFGQKEVTEEFSNADHDFTWGDTSHSLITRDKLKAAIEGLGQDDDGFDDDEDEELQAEKAEAKESFESGRKEVVARIESLDDDTFIDLSN